MTDSPSTPGRRTASPSTVLPVARPSAATGSSPGPYNQLSGPAERGPLGRIRGLLVNQATGITVGLGSGTGHNLPHVTAQVTNLHLVEPDPHKLRRLHSRIDESTTVHTTGAERLPFKDVDTVVSTLTLCSVQSPAAAAAGIRRVLKPEGQLLVLEGVRSLDQRIAARQDRLDRLWGHLAGGCHLNRDTAAMLASADLRPAHSRRTFLPGPLSQESRSLGCCGRRGAGATDGLPAHPDVYSSHTAPVANPVVLRIRRADSGPHCGRDARTEKAMNYISGHTDQLDRGDAPALGLGVSVDHDRVRPGSVRGGLTVTGYVLARGVLAVGRARPGPLGRLAGVAFRNRGRVVLGWIAAIALAAGLSAVFGGEFAADYSVPGSDSQRAQDLLVERFPAQAGDTVEVVFRAEEGVDDPAVQAEVAGLLGELSGLRHVAGVEDPYAAPGGVAPDGRTLLASLYLDLTNPEDMPVADTEQLLAAADAAERPGLDIAVGGSAIELAEMGEIGSEAIAFVAAGLILLVTFGSVVAAGLPLMVAIFGLTASAMLTGLIVAVIDVPDWTTALATMLGIALGIDYTLLMVTRFREWRAVGLDTEAATVATLDTAGRAVMVAGSTVVVSMLGLFAMGLSFMRGAAVVTIAAIVIVMAAAVTLFPALLGYLGTRVDRLRLPLGRRRPLRLADGGHVEPARGWVRWSRLVDRHSIIASGLGVGMLLALAYPFLDARFGFPDAGNNAQETSTRQAYDMVTEGFGAGANGPLILVADLSGSNETFVDELTTSVQNTAGVAAVLPPHPAPGGDAALITVIPENGPQHATTEDLVRQLRDTVIPTITDNSDANIHLSGITAIEIDSNSNTVKRLPFLIGGVAALSALLLLLSFRSIAIPITAAVMNLLSVAAAYGVIALFLQGGRLGQLIGIDTPTPMPAFIPVLVFAILFGLSMDYEVFLISRMRESWIRTNNNSTAIVDGLAGTGRVITAAAAIMVAVFAAFIPGDDVLIKVIGVGMGSAILIDATIVRMLLVPAIMHWLGQANWQLPTRLNHRIPQLHVEGQPQNHLPITTNHKTTNLTA